MLKITHPSIEVELANITHPIIAFKLNKTFSYDLSPMKLYDYTRHSWVVGERRNKARYAVAVYKDVIQEVYSIAQWFPQNTTLNNKQLSGEVSSEINKKRWEFVGNIAPKEIRDKYLHKDISKYIKSNQNPIAYINC